MKWQIGFNCSMTNSRRTASWCRSLRRTLTIALSVGSLSLGGLVSTATPSLASPPQTASARAQFNPVSVTFVSLDTGWALGTVPCPHDRACLALEQTFNAGGSWSARPLPAGLLAAARANSRSAVVNGGPGGSGLNVRFANLLDGWVYGGFPNGGAVLWSTHNGGASWHRVPLTGLANDDPILDLETARGTVYLMAIGKTQQRVAVESSPVGQNAWRLDQSPGLFLPAGGSQPVGSIVLQGGKGWLVEGNDRGISGSAELQGTNLWARWTPPCQSVGNSYTVPAASTADNLVAICVMGGFAFPLSKSAPLRVQSLGSTWAYFSGDGGRQLPGRPRTRPARAGPFFGAVLGSPVPGAIVTSRSINSTNQLVASFDGGSHWSVVFRGTFFYLGFTSSAQGVGLVQSPDGSTSMIMTFDSGHHWAHVNF